MKVTFTNPETLERVDITDEGNNTATVESFAADGTPTGTVSLTYTQLEAFIIENGFLST